MRAVPALALIVATLAPLATAASAQDVPAPGPPLASDHCAAADPMPMPVPPEPTVAPVPMPQLALDGPEPVPMPNVCGERADAAPPSPQILPVPPARLDGPDLDNDRFQEALPELQERLRIPPRFRFAPGPRRFELRRPGAVRRYERLLRPDAPPVAPPGDRE